MDKKIILASNSPRRREILTQGGYEYEVDAADINEDLGISDPVKLVEELSYQKALATAKNHPGCVVIGADTIVSFDGLILGKPGDEQGAVDMLKKLSGQTHQVITGVSVLSVSDDGADIKKVTFHEITDVTFYPLDDEEIAAYVATKEPMDKAGAYGIQGRGALLVKKIDGDYLNVVGLPLAALSRALLSI